MGYLSENPNAIHILEKNLDSTYLENRKIRTKVNWNWLSSNPNAIHILEKNLDKVDWDELSENPNIFKLNTEKIFTRLLEL